MFDQKATVHILLWCGCWLCLCTDFLFIPGAANTKITDGGNFHHLFLHLVEEVFKGSTSLAKEWIELYIDIVIFQRMWFDSSILKPMWPDRKACKDRGCVCLVQSRCSRNNNCWCSHPSDLRHSSLLPAAPSSVLLLGFPRLFLLQYLGIFYSLCLEVRYQPGPLLHLFQIFLQRIPSQWGPTCLLPFFFSYDHHRMISWYTDVLHILFLFIWFIVCPSTTRAWAPGGQGFLFDLVFVMYLVLRT